MESNTFIISISTNQEPLRQIETIRSIFRENFSQVEFSVFVSTKAIGDHYKTPFYNGAARIITSLSPEALTTLLKQLETQAGRTPEMKAAGIVPIDLDIIVYNDAVIHRDYERFPFVRKAIDALWLKK
jgi:2-amino-4-hydroxy-6-hydroxymethyldihydropteridine diphosphokinase